MHSSLLIAVECTARVHLIIGGNPLAGVRCARSLQAGAIPKLIAPDRSTLPFSLAKHIEEGDVEFIKREFRDDDLSQLGREEVGGFVDAVFVTLGARDPLSAHIASSCRSLRIPVNVTDAPHLCTFTLLSTFADGPLRIGVTTSGRGCRLAARICREIASYLPAGLGDAIDRLGAVRRRLCDEDLSASEKELGTTDEDGGQDANFNSLYDAENAEDARHRRTRWLSHICEYWPLKRLVALSKEDMEPLFAASGHVSSDFAAHRSPAGGIARTRAKKRGTIILAGAGAGHPALMTIAAFHALQMASLVLADKIVPSSILALIPRRTEVYIARKFPGNAEAAQEELCSLGLVALRAGRTVLRLKQGDPFLFGRGAEEVAFYRSHWFEPSIIPGVTSALAAPAVAGIPPTHRGVANHVVLCTGTGSKGVAPKPPTFLPGRSAVFLMALNRLAALVGELTDKAGWPLETPCAVVERASCADQRVIRTKLQFVCAAVEQLGSRPPGLLVVGGCCEVLEKCDGKWVVEEGYRGLHWLDDEMNLLGLLGDGQEWLHNTKAYSSLGRESNDRVL